MFLPSRLPYSHDLFSVVAEGFHGLVQRGLDAEYAHLCLHGEFDADNVVGFGSQCSQWSTELANPAFAWADVDATVERLDLVSLFLAGYWQPASQIGSVELDSVERLLELRRRVVLSPDAACSSLMALGDGIGRVERLGDGRTRLVREILQDIDQSKKGPVRVESLKQRDRFARLLEGVPHGAHAE